MSFLDERYLLSNDTAAALFKEVEGLPVVDAHNHSDIKEIAVNANYKNAWQVVAATDHYVWEMMRKRGVPEEYTFWSTSEERLRTSSSTRSRRRSTSM